MADLSGLDFTAHPGSDSERSYLTKTGELRESLSKIIARSDPQNRTPILPHIEFGQANYIAETQSIFITPFAYESLKKGHRRTLVHELSHHYIFALFGAPTVDLENGILQEGWADYYSWSILSSSSFKEKQGLVFDDVSHEAEFARVMAAQGFSEEHDWLTGMMLHGMPLRSLLWRLREGLDPVLLDNLIYRAISELAKSGVRFGNDFGPAAAKHQTGVYLDTLLRLSQDYPEIVAKVLSLRAEIGI